MTLYRASLSREALQKISKNERRLFFCLAHLLNEVTALHKLVAWTSDYSSERKAEVYGQVTFSFLFLKVLAGKLKEGWELLRGSFFASKVSQSYDGALSKEGQAALNELKRYFAGTNIINQIRNNYAFHYSPERMDDTLAEVPDDLEVYIDEGPKINSLFYFAEVLANQSMINDLFPDGDKKAFERFFNEIPEVAGWFLDFAEAFMLSFIERHEPAMWKEAAKAARLDDLRAFWDVKLPWFTDNSDLAKVPHNKAAAADIHSPDSGS